ncbi:MAG: zf-HC2 domain-containing protein [Nitrospira sp.]
MAYDLSALTAPDMTCRELVAHTSAYLDKQLDDALTRRTTLHLTGCVGCETYLNQINAIRNVLKHLVRGNAEPAQCDHLREAFSARQTPKVSPA